MASSIKNLINEKDKLEILNFSEQKEEISLNKNENKKELLESNKTKKIKRPVLNYDEIINDISVLNKKIKK